MTLSLISSLTPYATVSCNARGRQSRMRELRKLHQKKTAPALRAFCLLCSEKARRQELAISRSAVSSAASRDSRNAMKRAQFTDVQIVPCACKVGKNDGATTGGCPSGSVRWARCEDLSSKPSLWPSVCVYDRMGKRFLTLHSVRKDKGCVRSQTLKYDSYSNCTAFTDCIQD